MTSPNINRKIMDLFPEPSEVVGAVRREAALGGITRATEGCRAAIDEFTAAAEKTLSKEEQFRLGIACEYLAALSVEVSSWER